MALSVAEVLIRWRQEGQQQVQASTRSMGASMQKLGQQAKAAGQIMTVGLTAPLLLIGKQAVTAASDLNEATSAVTTVFGNASDEVLRFSRTASTNLGQSQQAALSAASAMGALFKGVGLTDQQMASFSTSLLTASADLGSFFNVDPTVAMDKLRSGLVGQSEPLREFGILLTEDTVKAKGLALGLGDAHGELSEGAKVQARYALIMEQVGSAQGDFARTSDGAANKGRILSAQVADLSAKVGGLLLPYYSRLIGVGQQLVQHFTDLSPEAQELAVKIGVIAAAAGPVLIVLGQVASSIGTLTPLLAALTGPIGLVVAGVVGLGIAWKENWFGIRDVTRNIVDGIKPTFDRMIQFFQAAKDRGLDPFRLAFRTLIVTLSERLGKEHPVIGFLQEVLRLGQRLGTAFADRDIAGAIEAISKSGGKLQDWLDEQFDSVSGFGATLVQRMANSLQGVNWDLVGNEVRTGLNDFATRTSLAEEPAWQKMLDDLIENTRREFEALRNAGTWANDNFVAADWNEATRTLGDRGVLFASELWRNTQEEFGQLKSAAQWVGDQLAGADWEAIGVAQNNRGSQIGNAFLEGMQVAQDEKWPAIKQWFANIPANAAAAVASVADPLGALLQAGRDILQGLWNGAIEKLAALIEWIKRIPATVVDSLPSVEDLGGMLYDKGAALMGGFKSGMESIMAEIQASLDAFNPTVPEVPSEPMTGGKNANVPEGGRAFGGLGSGQWVKVGETGWELAKRGSQSAIVGRDGPEFAKLSLGTMVIPHGAAQTRIQAMGGMANGGVANRWRDFSANANPASRRAWRRLKTGLSDNVGMSLREAREGILSGSIVLGPHGDYMTTGMRSSADRSAREARRAARTTRSAQQEHAMKSDALVRANAYGDRTGDYGRTERVLAREARRGTLAEGGLAQQERAAMNFYGPVHIHPPDADVAREIGRQMSSRSR